MAGDIFISYHTAEAQVVDQLYDGLVNVGDFEPWQVWRDRNTPVSRPNPGGFGAPARTARCRYQPASTDRSRFD